MLAYVRTLQGFLPCRVTARGAEGAAFVTLTATRGPWRKGEALTVPSRDIVRRPLQRKDGKLYGFAPHPEQWKALPKG